jgi:hypothetical protein
VNHVYEDEMDHPEVSNPSRPVDDVRTVENVPWDCDRAVVVVQVNEADRMAVKGDQDILPSALDAGPDPSREDGRLVVRLDDPNAYLDQQGQGAPVPGHTDEGIDETNWLAGQDLQEVYSMEGNLGNLAGNEGEKHEEVEILNGKEGDDEAV